MDNINSKTTIVWFFIVLFLISIFMLGWLLWPFVSIIIIAAVVTGVFNPVYKFINKKLNLKPVLASLITCVLIFLILFVPIVIFGSILTREAADYFELGRNALIDGQILEKFESSILLEKANLVLAKFNFEITADDLKDNVTKLATIIGRFIVDQTGILAKKGVSIFVDFFFMLLIVYYLLIDGKRFTQFIVELSPLPDDQDIKLIDKFKEMSGAILIGNGLGGLIQGTLGGLLFSIFGLPSPFLWGVIMGILAFLPIIGIGLVFVPTIIILFLKGKVGVGIFFLIFYGTITVLIEYLFKPKLVGDRVKMHTLLVFLAIIGGLKMFGILGIIYGPLVVTAFLTLTDIYYTNYQQHIDPDTKHRKVSNL